MNFLNEFFSEKTWIFTYNTSLLRVFFATEIQKKLSIENPDGNRVQQLLHNYIYNCPL